MGKGRRLLGHGILATFEQMVGFSRPAMTQIIKMALPSLRGSRLRFQKPKNISGLFQQKSVTSCRPLLTPQRQHSTSTDAMDCNHLADLKL